MSRFRRWSAAVLSRVDHIVAHVENHEAQVDSAIRDVHAAAARAKVQLARVRQDGARLRERLDASREAALRWEQRARASADDEKVALECLRRRKRTQRAIEEIERRLTEHQRVEGQLSADVAGVDDRLCKLREQRNLLRTRQSTAEALSSVHGERAPLVAELDELFDRWETRITEAEFMSGSLHDQDALEQEFLTREEEQELRIELSELTRS